MTALQKTVGNTYTLLAALLTWFVLSGVTSAATNYYVDDSAGGANDGSSWTDAYTNLQSALSVAVSNDEIWVAEGIYYPTNGTDRSATFQLVAGVSLYGGFTNGMETFAERDWTNYVTTLSGEIQQDVPNTNNSYHVVKGANNATLDGFTITNGYAKGANPNDRGAGMYNSSASPIITNCTFSGNSALQGGGMFNNSSSPTIINCTFSGNSTDYGGAMLNNSSSPTIINCTFNGNSASVNGGGMYNEVSSSPTIINCTFSGNSATGNGGGIHTSTSLTIENCTFSGNSGTSGGAMYNNSTPTIENCIFSGNSATSHGGGIYNTGSSPTIKNCTFSGNSAVTYGAGMYNNSSSPTITNCTFSANSASQGGGMYNNNSSSPTIENCTFSANSTDYGGAMCHESSSSPTIGNCIFWTNSAAVSGPEIYSDGSSTPSISYTDYDTNGVIGSVIEGNGNINTNPLFADVESGTWTGDGVYDAGSGKTVLSNSSASWTAGELIGKTVNPNTSQILQLAVFANAVKTITIWGDASSMGTNGAPYQIHDYHLKSTSGRWTSIGWVTDPVHSPCIDAGNPNSERSLEPRPNGGRINMGAYGNTAQASKSFFIPSGTMFSVR